MLWRLFCDQSVSRKLSVAFIALLLVFSGAFSITFVAHSDAIKARQAERETIQFLVQVDKLTKSATSQFLAVRGFLLTGDRNYLPTFESSVASFDEQSKAIIVNAPPPLQLALSEMIDTVKRWQTSVARKQINLMRHPLTIDEARMLAANGLGESFLAEMRSYESTIALYAFEQASAVMKVEQSAYLTAKHTFFFSAILSLSIVFAAYIALRNSITRPLSNITRTMFKLAKGESSGALPDCSRKDEIGTLAQAFSAFKKAVSANDAKSQFLAQISHELRTPLNPIIGFSEIIADQMMGHDSTEVYIQYARDIHTSGLHMLALINDILDLSKIEIGEVSVNESIVPIEDLLEDIQTTFAEQFLEKNLSVAIQKPQSPLSLWADKDRVRQVLYNLITNAIKFTQPRGHVKVKARLHKDGGILLSVSDTGIGIPAQDLQHILEPFTQVGRNAFHASEGVGLGLAIANTIVKLHGGSISIKSKSGKGTHVEVHFPAERTESSMHFAAMLPVVGQESRSP